MTSCDMTSEMTLTDDVGVTLMGDDELGIKTESIEMYDSPTALSVNQSGKT